MKITVKDTGVGISKSNQEKLFKLFGYVKSKDGVNSGGIGLGLLISKKICDQFGGTINLISEVGKGSEFSFVLKLIKPNEIENLQTKHNTNILVCNSQKLFFYWRPQFQYEN